MTKERNDPSDIEALLRRSRSGDDAAWARLVDRYQNLVYSVPRRMGLAKDDAEDVFQTTFLALYKNLDRLENPATLAKWLAVTASRESIRVRRSNVRRSHETPDGRTLDELVADDEASAEDNATTAVESDMVRSALVALDEKCRQLLRLLFFGEEASYQEIVERTGMAVGSIGPTRARCLEKLRATLSKSGFFSDSEYQESGERHL